ncbi:MAG: hypothetical protein ACOYMA_11175 [Bacteroidia bacterium]
MIFRYSKKFINFLLATCFLCYLPTTNLKAQEKKTKNKFKISGNLSVSQEFFSYNSNDSLYRPYRPESVTRFMGSTSFSYGKFSLPFSIAYTLQQGTAEYNSPIPTTFSWSDLLNYYNQLSLSPTYKSFQGFIGTQIPKYSELTCGDLPVFGLGFNWKPKKFRAAAFYGNSQRGVSTDTLLRVPGSYQRTSYGAKLGIGLEDSTHLYLIALFHKDDPNSAVVKSQGVSSKENVVISVDQMYWIAKRIFFKLETAISAFSPDLKDASLESDSFKLNVPSFLTSLYTPRYTSNYGVAGSSGIGYVAKKWSIRGKMRLFSPDYKTLSYPFLQNDRLEWTIEPKFSLFKSRINIDGSYGKRTDNLFKNKLATAYQDLLSANLNLQITKSWNFNATYSNFGIRNTISNDTFRLQNSSQNLGLSSSYNIVGKKFGHTFMAAWTQDQFVDYNIVSGGQMNNQTKVYILGYSLALVEKPLSISLNGTYFENNLAVGKVNFKMLSLSESYVFGKKKNINASLSQNYQITSLEPFEPDENINVTTSLSYTVAKGLNLGTTGSLVFFKYGSAKPGVQNRENSIRITASYSF